MSEHETQPDPRHPARRAPSDNAYRPGPRTGGGQDSPRHLTHGGASAAVGETDVILYRTYAIVERLRRAVEERV